MKKRIFSILLAAIMVIGLLPATVFAVDIPDEWRNRFGTYNGYGFNEDLQEEELLATVSFDEDALTITMLIEEIPEEFREQEFRSISGVYFANEQGYIDYGESGSFESVFWEEGKLLCRGLRLEKMESIHKWEIRVQRGSEYGESWVEKPDRILASCTNPECPECPYRLDEHGDGLYISLYMENGRPVIGPAEKVKEWKRAGLPMPKISYVEYAVERPWDMTNPADWLTTIPENEYGMYTAWISVELPQTGEEHGPHPEPARIAIQFKYEDLSKKYYYSGEGTEKSPYQISNLTQLIDLAAAVNGRTLGYGEPNDMSGKYFVLGSDIGGEYGGGGMPISIGRDEWSPFKGNFDGRGHTVYLDSGKWPEEYEDLSYGKDSCTGLFGQLGGEYDEDKQGVIRNVTVAGIIDGGEDDTFGAVCYQNYGTIQNCVNRAVTAEGYVGVGGGICCNNNGIIEDCVNYANITASGESIGHGGRSCGGICVNNDHIIRGCVNYGNIVPSIELAYFGGVCGQNNENGTILNCVNAGVVMGKGCFGGVSGLSFGKIHNCVNRGKVSSGEEGGGSFAGICASDACSNFINCINIGEMEAVEGCGSHGAIGGSTFGTFENCYYDSSVIKVSTEPEGVFALSTAQMQAAHSEVISGEGVPQGGKALVDLLNEYIDDNSADTEGWWHWTKDADGYPYPIKTSYQITVNSAEHGKVTVVSSYMEPGTWDNPKTVTVIVTPDETYALKSLKYNDGADHDITSTGSFNMPEKNVTITAEFGPAKSAPTADEFNFAAPTDCVYDGNPKTAAVTAKNEGMGAITAVKYRADGELNWTDAPTDVGTYQVGVTVAEGDSNLATTDVLTDVSWKFTITKGVQSVNITASATNNRITVNPVAGAKYKLGDGEWQESNVFEDLNAGTTYTVSVQVPETDNCLAAEQTVSVKTLAAKIVTEGTVEVNVQGETNTKDAEVDSGITELTKKYAAQQIAGAINSASSAENKSDIVDLTAVVNNKLSAMTLESLKKLAEEKGTNSELAALLAAADSAKGESQTVDMSMKMTTDIRVSITDVKLVTSDTSKIQTFTLDISPVYTLVVESKINGSASGSVTVAENEPLEVTETTTVSFPAPQGFELNEDDVLYIIHTKANGDKYTYVANYDKTTKMISFTNPHGFSEFEMVKASGMVAQNVTTEVFYPTLTDALAAAGENQTVILLRDLTGDYAASLVEVAPGVTLDLNGFDLKASLVVAFGLVKDGGETRGKLIVAQDHFAYLGGKEMGTSAENVLPVWDTDGYVFYAVDAIENVWYPALGAGNPTYYSRPESDDISTILAESSGVKVLVEIEYKGSGNDYYDKMTVEFVRKYVADFLSRYEDNYGMYVTLLGTDNIVEIRARTNLKSDKSNFSIISDWQ